MGSALCSPSIREDGVILRDVSDTLCPKIIYLSLCVHGGAAENAKYHLVQVQSISWHRFSGFPVVSTIQHVLTNT